MVSATAETAETETLFQGTYHGAADQVGRARREVAGYLKGCPVADDAVLIVSELATNAVLHSQSRSRSFTIRVRLHAGRAWIQCQDLGGPWRSRRADGRSHGLGIVEALTGPGNWGVETNANGHRTVWASLPL